MYLLNAVTQPGCSLGSFRLIQVETKYSHLHVSGAFEGNAYSNCQQDVSEFTSKLLEWVEEALNIYKSSCETPTFVAGSPSDKENKLMTSDVAGSGQTQLDLTGHSSLPQPCTGHDFSPEQMLHQLKQV